MRKSASVIIPIYNGVDHLTTLMGNLAAFKNTPNIEFIIVDDGSTDGTCEQLERATTNISNVSLIRHKKNQGVCAARKTAIQAAKNEFVWLVDVDDFWTPAGLEALLSAASSNESDIVIGSARYLYPSGQVRNLPAPKSRIISGDEAFRLLLHGKIKGHLWNKLIRTAIFDQIHFPSTRAHSDLALTAQVLLNSVTVQLTPHQVYEYRISTNSIITSRKPRWDSLIQVHNVIESAICRKEPKLLTTRAYKYFICRYLVVSGLKDLNASNYNTEQQKKNKQFLLEKVDLVGILGFVLQKDFTGLSLILVAKCAPGLLPILIRLTKRS